MVPVRIVTLAPGHFHAALIQKEMQPGIDRTVHVYSPLDADLAAHVGRIASFNARGENPTSWQMEVHASDDWPERFLRERPGNVAVLSGRNRPKIDLLRLAVDAGMHVLADKPWIIEPGDLPKLEAVVAKASQAGLIVYDMMTERYEITSILQRAIVTDPELFGNIENGDAQRPGVAMESVHYLKKQVAGAPLRRPGWFFDIAQQGESLADVGTHLVDQVTWTLFRDQPIETSQVRILDARRWPTLLDREQFGSITGYSEFPVAVQSGVKDDRLHYYCNNQIVYSVRGICVRLDVKWDYEAPTGGGDTHNAIYHGSRCSAAIRQKGGQLPELFVVPKPDCRRQVRETLARRVDAWQGLYPGVHCDDLGDEFHVVIPAALRTSHETHFAQVTAQFLKYIERPDTLPAWEASHLLAKYFTTTHGVARARRFGA